MSRPVSCGVIVTDGHHILLGHATRSPRWDIPKGLAEPGEAHEAAARRELWEEMGLEAAAGTLSDLGIHRYLPAKNLALFTLHLDKLPDLPTLRCRSLVGTGPSAFPEFDRFAAPPWAAAMDMVGRSMRGTLAPIAQRLGWLPSG